MLKSSLSNYTNPDQTATKREFDLGLQCLFQTKLLDKVCDGLFNFKTQFYIKYIYTYTLIME